METKKKSNIILGIVGALGVAGLLFYLKKRKEANEELISEEELGNAMMGGYSENQEGEETAIAKSLYQGLGEVKETPQGAFLLDTSDRAITNTAKMLIAYDYLKANRGKPFDRKKYPHQYYFLKYMFHNYYYHPISHKRPVFDSSKSIMYYTALTKNSNTDNKQLVYASVEPLRKAGYRIATREKGGYVDGYKIDNKYPAMLKEMSVDDLLNKVKGMVKFVRNTFNAVPKYTDDNEQIGVGNNLDIAVFSFLMLRLRGYPAIKWDTRKARYITNPEIFDIVYYAKKKRAWFKKGGQLQNVPLAMVSALYKIKLPVPNSLPTTAISEDMLATLIYFGSVYGKVGGLPNYGSMTTYNKAKELENKGSDVDWDKVFDPKNYYVSAIQLKAINEAIAKSFKNNCGIALSIFDSILNMDTAGMYYRNEFLGSECKKKSINYQGSVSSNKRTGNTSRRLNRKNIKVIKVAKMK